MKGLPYIALTIEGDRKGDQWTEVNTVTLPSTWELWHHHAEWFVCRRLSLSGTLVCLYDGYGPYKVFSVVSTLKRAYPPEGVEHKPSPEREITLQRKRRAFKVSEGDQVYHPDYSPWTDWVPVDS